MDGLRQKSRRLRQAVKHGDGLIFIMSWIHVQSRRATEAAPRLRGFWPEARHGTAVDVDSHSFRVVILGWHRTLGEWGQQEPGNWD